VDKLLVWWWMRRPEPFTMTAHGPHLTCSRRQHVREVVRPSSDPEKEFSGYDKAEKVQEPVNILLDGRAHGVLQKPSLRTLEDVYTMSSWPYSRSKLCYNTNIELMDQAASPSLGRVRDSPHHPEITSARESELETPSRAKVVLSLINYEDLFTDINEHPEGDVRHRFLSQRSKRARYVESLVVDRFNALLALERTVTSRTVDPSDDEFLSSYDAAMKSFDAALKWISKSERSHSLSPSFLLTSNRPCVQR
jgi:hypothetical protein